MAPRLLAYHHVRAACVIRDPRHLEARAGATTIGVESRARATVRASAGDLDDDVKRLLAAILEFSAVTRRDEAPDKDSSLDLGGAMRRHGLGQRHASALLTVALWGPMTVSDVARRHHVQVKTASLVAVELEEAGLLARRTDPADRRRTILAVPAAKEQVVEAGLRKRAARLRKVLDGLTATQREGLILGLEELARQQSAATSTTSRDSDGFR